MYAAVGGVASLGVAYGGAEVFRRLYPAAAFWDAAIDARVIGFALLLVVVAGALSCLAPMRGLLRSGFTASQLGGWIVSMPRAKKMQRVMVATQVAICTILLLITSVVLDMTVRLTDVRLGFDPNGVVTTAFSMQGEDGASLEGFAAYYGRVLSRLREVSGVQFAAVVNNLPLETGLNIPIHAPTENCRGCNAIGSDRVANVQWRYVTPDYFRVMGIPLVAGRGLVDGDGAGAPPVTLVNQAFMEFFYGNSQTSRRVGTTVEVYAPVPELVDDRRTIVGVVGNVVTGGLSRPAEPTMYVPVAQVPSALLTLVHGFFEVKWVVRILGDSGALIPAIEDAIRSENRRIAVGRFQAMQTIVFDFISRERFRATLFALFGGFSLLLAALGVYGLMWRVAVSRAREVAVRLALGAERARIVRGFLLQAMLPVATGGLVGVVVAIMAARSLGAFLFGTDTIDSGALVAVVGLLTLVTALSAFWATWGVATQDPAITLRADAE